MELLYANERPETKERNNGTSPLSKAAEKLAKKCRTKRCDGNCELLLLLLFSVVVFVGSTVCCVFVVKCLKMMLMLSPGQTKT